MPFALAPDKKSLWSFFKETLPSDNSAKKLKSSVAYSAVNKRYVYADNPTKGSDRLTTIPSGEAPSHGNNRLTTNPQSPTVKPLLER